VASVALEALGVVRALIGLSVLRRDHFAAADALGVVLLLVVLLAVESTAALGELGQRLMARGANKAVGVVLGAVDVADVRSAGNVLVAASADVKSGEMALLAVGQTGTRCKEVIVSKVLATRGAVPAIEVIVLAKDLEEVVRLVDLTLALIADA